MSAYSDYTNGYISESEYISAMRRECGDRYDEIPEPYHYTCDDCEFCKNGMVFVREIVKREGDNRLVTKTNRARYGYASFCVRNPENIREIWETDDVCDDHGELFCPD